MKPAREPASSRPKPCASLEKPHESCPFAAPCWSRRKKTDRGQRSAFPSEISLFAPCVLVSPRGFSRPTPRRPAHLPFPERIWCLLTCPSPPSSFPWRYASFGAMDRWYERSGLWVQLAVHRQRHRICRNDHITPGLLTFIVSSLPRFGSRGSPGRAKLGVNES